MKVFSSKPRLLIPLLLALLLLGSSKAIDVENTLLNYKPFPEQTIIKGDTVGFFFDDHFTGGVNNSYVVHSQGKEIQLP